MIKKQIRNLFIFIQIVILYLFDFLFSYIKFNKKIFVIGVDEVANNIVFLKNIFKENSVSVSMSKNKFYDVTYDYSLNIENRYFYFLMRIFYGPYLLAKLANQSDIFIYFWWSGFCLDREVDYKFLNKKRKKIVCMFVGDDIRSRKLTKEYYEEKKLDSYVFYDHYNIEENELRVKKVAYLADMYADLIFSHPLDQLSYLKKPFIQNRYRLKDSYLMHNVCKFNDKSIIKVVHAPSNPLVKGTPLVRAAIKKLQLEGYQFEYIEIQNKPNQEVLKILESSHIVLNQFYLLAPGLYGIEAMAKSNAVLMSAVYEGMPQGAEKAWLKTRYWEVYDNLRYLLDNPKKIEAYAQHGYDLVKQHYTEGKVKQFYIDTFYEHKIIDDKNIF